MVKTFKDLIVWKKAHDLTLEIYKFTKSFPSDEKFGIVSQLRRSACSIATNIVEGHKRSSRKDFLHFLNIARGSLEETKYLLLLSKDLGYLKDSEYCMTEKLSDEVGKVLYGFERSLR